MKTAAREVAFAACCAVVGVGMSAILSEMLPLRDNQTVAMIGVPAVAFYAYRLATWAKRMARG